METSINVPDEQDRPWHTLEVHEVLLVQGVEAASGLSAGEVRKRLQEYGPNRFAEASKEPAWHAFLRQYRDPMQLVLVGAGLLSALAIRQWGTALVLWALTLFNALMGLHQEGKAEASVAALQQMMIVTVRVRRDQRLVEIASEDVVPGDIVVLEAGDRVPADGRIIKAASLEIDESALTGESLPVPKQVEVVTVADAPLGDRADMAYMNTHVTHGAGEFVVAATGMATEVRHISGLLQTTQTEETPLTRQLDTLTRQIILIACLALAISILLDYSRGQTLETLFLTGIAFAVAAIPTGLPAVVTFLLARGTTQLAASGAIVKRLRSLETLGATSAINTNKTGTLTLNQMTAISMTIAGRQVTATGEGYASNGQLTQTGGKPPIDLAPFLLPMVLASDARVKDGALVGDPTEGALVVFATKGGLDVETTRQEFPRLAEVPFDAAYKLMATFHRMQDEQGQEVIRCCVKGAPDELLARSSQGLDALLSSSQSPLFWQAKCSNKSTYASHWGVIARSSSWIRFVSCSPQLLLWQRRVKHVLLLCKD
jgi:P-type Ca2+ transporter type 2C